MDTYLESNIPTYFHKILSLMFDDMEKKKVSLLDVKKISDNLCRFVYGR